MRTPRSSTAADAGTPSPPPVRGRRAHAGPPADEGPEDPSGASPDTASARALRPRTVRAKIVCLLMVPVVSLLALWAFASVTTAQDVARLRQLQRVDDGIRNPVTAAVAALQAERTAAVRYATDPSPGRAADFKELSEDSRAAVAKLRLGKRNTVADGEEFPTGVAPRLTTFVTGAERLSVVRDDVLDRRSGWQGAYGRYTETIESAFAVLGALTGVQDAELGSDARVLLEFARAGEALAQEQAVLDSARLAGRLDGTRLRLFTGAVGTRRTLTASAVADLRGSRRAAWQRLATGDDYATVTALEETVTATRPGSPAPAADAGPGAGWSAAHARVQGAMRTIQQDAGRAVAERADPFTRGLLTPAGAAVLFGLLAVVASLVISVRIGRGLVVELVTLRDTALEIARHKLPEAMRRLRAGEEIDVRGEAPPGPPAEDEAGQVGEALNTVHRAALRAAVERAELASGVSGIFVNLARRSQVLVHRQLTLLDSMERRSDDPNELSDLFRLDHLTTRMRRHAESLIILSGAAPGRAWRMPVSLTDVVRAAVSEVEDYARVEVRRLPEASVLGAAVADLTHLLAELVENAAQFSPPHTRVRITGEPVGNGYAVEVEDRGLGMGKEALAEANRRIEQSEALDLFDSDRLGLFVVSRLASRHGIKVHLSTSPYGGTTAVVLLPTALLHDSPAERSTQDTAHAERPAEHDYARVPVTERRQESVPTAAERPALVAPAPAAPEPTRTPPPGVTTLRLHRPPDDPGTTEDLPRRVRQASLAPQLRERHADDTARTAPAERPDHGRTPEVVRDRMAAYRDGWARGGGRPPGSDTSSDPAQRHDGTEGDLA
ncbi:sensor histidine kinase [Streptomyces sp. NPDC004822]